MLERPLQEPIRVLVHNMARANLVLQSVMDTAVKRGADLVLLQEPSLGAFQPTFPDFHKLTVTPFPNVNQPSRVLAFVSKLRPSLTVTDRSDLVHDPDVQLLEISTPSIPPIRLYNTYNHESHALPGRADTRILANQNLQQRAIIAGDFNARHPLWESKVPPNGINAAALYDIIENNSLDLLNEPDLPTRIGPSGSVIDLVLASEDLHDQVGGWALERDDTSGSDHYAMWFTIMPQVTAHDQPVESPFTGRFDYRKTDWDLFSQKLREITLGVDAQLQELLFSGLEVNFDTAARLLTDAITLATQASTPTPAPSHPKHKRWWNDAL